MGGLIFSASGAVSNAHDTPGIGLRVRTVRSNGVPDTDSSLVATSLPIAPNPISPIRRLIADIFGSCKPIRRSSGAHRDACRVRRRHSPWSRADPGPA